MNDNGIHPFMQDQSLTIDHHIQRALNTFILQANLISRNVQAQFAGVNAQLLALDAQFPVHLGSKNNQFESVILQFEIVNTQSAAYFAQP